MTKGYYATGRKVYAPTGCYEFLFNPEEWSPIPVSLFPVVDNNDRNGHCVVPRGSDGLQMARGCVDHEGLPNEWEASAGGYQNVNGSRGRENRSASQGGGGMSYGSSIYSFGLPLNVNVNVSDYELLCQLKDNAPLMAFLRPDYSEDSFLFHAEGALVIIRRQRGNTFEVSLPTRHLGRFKPQEFVRFAHTLEALLNYLSHSASIP